MQGKNERRARVAVREWGGQRRAGGAGARGRSGSDGNRGRRRWQQPWAMAALGFSNIFENLQKLKISKFL